MFDANELWGGVVDIPFPMVDPEATESEIDVLAKSCSKSILDRLHEVPEGNHAVHIMGELTLCYQIVLLLKKSNITCVASTSSRVSHEEDGIRLSEFKFVKFRKY